MFGYVVTLIQNITTYHNNFFSFVFVFVSYVTLVVVKIFVFFVFFFNNLFLFLCFVSLVLKTKNIVSWLLFIIWLLLLLLVICMNYTAMIKLVSSRMNIWFVCKFLTNFGSFCLVLLNVRWVVCFCFSYCCCAFAFVFFYLCCCLEHELYCFYSLLLLLLLCGVYYSAFACIVLCSANAYITPLSWMVSGEWLYKCAALWQ